MATLRLTLIGSVILALLGGLGGTVSAQTGAGSELSGTVVYIDGVMTYETGDLDKVMKLQLSTSDPRASGTFTMFSPDGDAYDSGAQRPAEVGLRRVELANDAGSWNGQLWALWHDDIGWRLTAWLAGEGSYEGQSLYLYGQRFPIYSQPTMDFDGLIFEGEAPPVPQALEPATD